MGTEFELKYRADEITVEAIREKFGTFASIEMETAYYDTPDRDFARRHWTLRRRRENGTGVCTLKTPAPDGSRGEWELQCDDIEAAIEELCKLGAPRELRRLTQQPLHISCGAKFTRLAKQLQLPGAEAELALDRGVLLCGSRQVPFAEVEAELKQGSREAVLDFARELAREFGLTPELRSKHRRALDLAEEQI